MMEDLTVDLLCLSCQEKVRLWKQQFGDQNENWQPPWRDKDWQPPWRDEVPKFGQFLAQCRLRAGFRSQRDVVQKVKELNSPIPLSTSMLSLYEKGKVKNLNPETAWLLSQLYRVPCDEVVYHWVEERFGISLPVTA